METKFTPGPWNYKYDEQHDCFNIAGKENTVNDYVCRVENDFIAEYDAKLIASAPDMLETLVSCRDYLKMHMDNNKLDQVGINVLSWVNDSIKKATK